MNQVSLLNTHCVRCGKPCRPGENKNPHARPFKRARKGLCENCAVTQFLKCRELEPLTLGLLRNGIEILKEPVIQNQFSKILEAGGSELQIEQINWDAVIEKWQMPFPKGYQP